MLLCWSFNWMPLAVLLFATGMKADEEGLANCDQKVDLIISWQGGDAVTWDEFDYQREFSKSIIIMATKYGPEGLMISILQMNSGAREEIQLPQYPVEYDVMYAISYQIPHDYQSTGFDQVYFPFEKAKSTFKYSAAGRPDALRVIIIITSRPSNPENWFNDKMNAWNLEKNLGVRIITIGIGDQFDKDQVRLEASHPSLHYQIDNFSDLASLLPSMKNILCQGGPEIRSFTINNQTENVSGEAGSLFNFHCLAEGNPQPAVSVYGEQTEIDVISNDNEDTSWYNGVVNHDVILGSRHSDTYTCVASNSLGTRKATIAVRVRGAPRRYGLSAEPIFTSVDENDKVFIIEPVICHPKPVNFTLARQTGPEDSPTVVPVPQSDFNAKFEEVDVRYGNVILNFSLPPYESVNHYILSLNNGVGQLDIPITVTGSQVVPHILEFTVNSNTGYVFVSTETAVRLQCKADGQSPPTVSLYRQFAQERVFSHAPVPDSLVQEVDFTLTLGSRQSDVYICEARNDQGVDRRSVRVVVNAACELFQVPAPEMSTTVGQDGQVSFTVPVICHSEPVRITLDRQTGPDDSPTTVPLARSEFNATYEDVDVRYANAHVEFVTSDPHVDSTYIMTVDNGSGPLVIPFKVFGANVAPKVTAFTINSGTGTVTVAAGSLVRFRCEAEGHPGFSMAITGQLSNVNVIDDLSTQEEENMDLTLQAASERTDIYLCTASSYGGIEESSVTLIVEGPPVLHDASENQFEITVHGDGVVTISFHIVCHPVPRTYTLVWHRDQDNGGDSEVESTDYDVSFTEENIRYGKVLLVLRAPTYDYINHYTLTVDNSQGQLPLRFDAVKAGESTEENYTRVVVAAAVCGGILFLILLVLLITCCLYCIRKPRNKEHKTRTAQPTELRDIDARRGRHIANYRNGQDRHLYYHNPYPFPNRSQFVY